MCKELYENSKIQKDLIRYEAQRNVIIFFFFINVKELTIPARHVITKLTSVLQMYFFHSKKFSKCKVFTDVTIVNQIHLSSSKSTLNVSK